MSKKSYEVGFVFGAKKANGFDGTFKGIAASIGGIGKAIAGVAGAYVGIRTIKDAVGTFATFEQSMANVQAVSQASAEDFKALEDAALEMGRKTSKTAAESADALSYMALAGWSTQESIAGLEPILRSSEAFSMDLATASDLVTDSMSAMGIEVNELTSYLDIVAKAQASANANGQQMMEAYLNVGGKLKDMNADMTESAAILGLMANRGSKGSEAGNSLNTILMRMTASTGESAKAMQALGISAFDSEGNWRDLEAVFMDVHDALEGMTEQEQAYYKDMIAGKNHSENFSKIMAGLGEEYHGLKAEIADCDEALMDTAETMNATFQGAMARLSSATDDLKIRVVKAFGDDMTGAVDWAAEKIPQATEKIIGGIGWLKDKAGPIVKTFADNTKTRLTAVKNTMGKFAAGDWQGGSADILSAMGLNDDSIAAVQSFAGTVGRGFRKVADGAKPMAAAVGSFFGKIRDTAGQAGNFLIQKALPVVEKVAGFVVDKVMPPVINFFTENIPRIGAIFQNIWGIIQPIIATFIQRIQLIWEVAEPVIGALVEGFTGFASGIMKALEGVTAFISGVFAGDWGKAWQGVKDIFSGIFEGLDAIFKAPINAIIGLINKAIEGINGIGFSLPDWLPFGLGGKEFGGLNIPTIPALASGGIATKATLAMVGEGRESEAILPLSKLKGLLGDMGGGPVAALIQKLLAQGGGDDDPPIHFNPVFNFYGPASKEDVKEATRQSFEEFKKMYQQLKREEKRKGLAAN